VSNSPAGALQGYDPGEAPTFRRPPEVIKTFKRIEAERAAKRRKQ